VIFLVLAIEPDGEDIAFIGELETARGTMASSANIGRVLWPKKAKTHEINEIATKNPRSGFELSFMTVLLAALRHAERLLFVHGRLI
jgi:hypothetical protein